MEEEGKMRGCSFAAVKHILQLIANERCCCSSSAPLSAAALRVLAALYVAGLLCPSSELVQAAKEKTLFLS